MDRNSEGVLCKSYLFVIEECEDMTEAELQKVIKTIIETKEVRLEDVPFQGGTYETIRNIKPNVSSLFNAGD